MSETVGNILGAEWELPPVRRFLDKSFIGPIIISFISFYIVGQLVRKSFWTHYSGITRYRLQNLSVSLTHSTIAGGYALVFAVLNPKVMFEDTIHWYCECAAQLVHLSMGYFVYDTVDVLLHDRTIYAFEVTAHHVAAFTIFSIGMLPQKFLPYAYWALLVEVNCVFLHIRTLMQLYNNTLNIQYQMIRLLSIMSFLIFRFGVLGWMLQFIVLNRDKYHTFYTVSGSLAVSFFLIFSAVLFREVLYDRIVGTNEQGKKRSTQRVQLEKSKRKKSR